MSQYISNINVSDDIKNVAKPLISVAIDLHEKVQKNFLPTAIKFHYSFNLRDLSNIFQVIKSFEETHFEICSNLKKGYDVYE